MKLRSKIVERYPFNSSGLEDAKYFLLKKAQVFNADNPLVFRLEFVDHQDKISAVIEYSQRPPIPRGTYGNKTAHDFSLLEKMSGHPVSVRGDLVGFNLPSRDFLRFRSALESRGFVFEISGLSNKSASELNK